MSCRSQTLRQNVKSADVPSYKSYAGPFCKAGDPLITDKIAWFSIYVEVSRNHLDIG